MFHQAGPVVATQVIRPTSKPSPRPRDHSGPAQQNSTSPTHECVCGQVCVCLVDHDLLRPLASYLAAHHHGQPCVCGDTFCGYGRYTALMFAGGAFYRV